MGSVYIYKTVEPSVNVPKPTANSSITKQISLDFEYDDIGVSYIFKYKYFNGGMNYNLLLQNIDVNKDIDDSKNFEKLGPTLVIYFDDEDEFQIIDSRKISLSDFTRLIDETEGDSFVKNGFIEMTRDTFDLITSISLGH